MYSSVEHGKEKVTRPSLRAQRVFAVTSLNLYTHNYNKIVPSNLKLWLHLKDVLRLQELDVGEQFSVITITLPLNINIETECCSSLGSA